MTFRANRAYRAYRQTWVTFGMLAASMAGGALGGALLQGGVEAQGASVVTAAQINVVDGDGRLRAVLTGRDERGMTSLSFYDSAGQVRSVVGLESDDSPVVRLSTGTGESRLFATVSGEDALIVAGNERTATAIVGAVDGSPLVGLAQGDRPRLRMQLNDEGSPFLGMFGGDGQRAASLTVDATDAPVMTLYRDGRSRVALGVVQDAAVLNLSDPARARLVVGVADTGWPSVTFLTEEGGVIQQLPAVP